MFDFLASQVFLTFPLIDLKLNSFYNKGFTSIFKYSRDTTHVVALDFANFMSTSLEKIGEIVGRPKMKIDFDKASESELIEYCRNDVEVMRDALFLWIQFLRDNDLGAFRTTIASTAFNIFRYRFIPCKIFIHDSSQALDLEDKAYHGGRVESNRVGFFNSDTYYKLDIRSMYPYICSTYKFPVSLYDVIDNPTIETLQSKLQNYAVIAEVRLRTDENPYPLLHKSKLLYPIGHFTTVLSTPELQYAIEHGHIDRVYRMAFYQQQYIFKEYMDFFYHLRLKYKQTGNEVFDKICKMLMNSLYGKFGQRGLEQRIIGNNMYLQTKIESGYNELTDSSFTQYWLGQYVYETTQSGYSYNAFPAIASHVTAYARMYLYLLKSIAGHERVYYNDTDSLFTDSTGYENLKPYIHSENLGSLAVEEICDWLEIFCPKNYNTPETSKHKGVRHSAIEFAPNSFAQEQFAGLNGMIRRGILDSVSVKLIEKRLTMKITHGYSPDSQGFVKPFEFERFDGQNLLIERLPLHPSGLMQSELESVLAMSKAFYRQS